MKRMSVREFKNSFHRVTEPIEVLNRTTTIGMFYPTGFGPSRRADPIVISESEFGPVHGAPAQPKSFGQQWAAKGPISKKDADHILAENTRVYDAHFTAAIHDAEHHGKMIKGCIYCNGDM